MGGGSLLDLVYEYDDVGNVVQIEDGQVLTQTQSFTYDALDRLTGASAQAGGPWAAYSGSYEYDRVGNLRLKAEGGITHTMQYSDTAHVHAVSAVDGVAQTYDANGNMTERVVDGVTYAQGWDQENRLVWVSTGGVTTTFTYDANGALVKKEDPLVGTTYYVGPHYEVLVPAVILPPAPTDLEACRESGSPPNVCNYLSWTGSAGVTYNVYRSTTSPVPIDAGHRVTSGITETNYTDCGNVNNRYYAVTAVNENGESDPSNEDRASEPCGSAMAMTLPVLNATALTESGGDPVVTKYYFVGGKRVAMDREGVVQWLDRRPPGDDEPGAERGRHGAQRGAPLSLWRGAVEQRYVTNRLSIHRATERPTPVVRQQVAGRGRGCSPQKADLQQYAEGKTRCVDEHRTTIGPPSSVAQPCP